MLGYITTLLQCSVLQCYSATLLPYCSPHLTSRVMYCLVSNPMSHLAHNPHMFLIWYWPTSLLVPHMVLTHTPPGSSHGVWPISVSHRVGLYGFIFSYVYYSPHVSHMVGYTMFVTSLCFLTWSCMFTTALLFLIVLVCLLGNNVIEYCMYIVKWWHIFYIISKCLCCIWYMTTRVPCLCCMYMVHG